MTSGSDRPGPATWDGRPKVPTRSGGHVAAAAATKRPHVVRREGVPVSMVPLYPEDGPLYGDVPISQLAMVVQCKAMVDARRHLFHDHGFKREQLRETRARILLGWHLQTHNLPVDTEFPRSAIPYGLVRVVHRIAAEQGGAPTTTTPKDQQDGRAEG
jgi:hypothetical protein